MPQQTFSRAALYDALAWPVALTVSAGALALAIAARLSPPPFRLPAMAACVAVLAAALVFVVARRIEQWMHREAAALGSSAGTLVPADGTGAVHLEHAPAVMLPLLAPLVDIAARRARRSARQAHAGELASWTAGASAALLAQVDDRARQQQVLHRLRDVTAPVRVDTRPVDLAEVVRTAAHTIADAGLDTVVHVESMPLPVRTDAAQLREVLAVLLRIAVAASPPGAPPTVHVARVFRSTVEDEPVRRASDDTRTIVPRTPVTPLRTWAAQSKPPAELARVVIADRGTAPTDEQLARALEPFAEPRPGDPHGVALAHLARLAAASDGTAYVSSAREGGWAVHLLLPIVATD